eukprot:4857437-Prymnesium_polylepis.3
MKQMRARNIARLRQPPCTPMIQRDALPCSDWDAHPAEGWSPCAEGEASDRITSGRRGRHSKRRGPTMPTRSSTSPS